MSHTHASPTAFVSCDRTFSSVDVIMASAATAAPKIMSGACQNFKPCQRHHDVRSRRQPGFNEHSAEDLSWKGGGGGEGGREGGREGGMVW